MGAWFSHPASEADIAAVIQAANQGWLLGGSILIVAVILGLMMFKLF